MTSTYLVIYNIYGEVDEGLTGLRHALPDGHHVKYGVTLRMFTR